MFSAISEIEFLLCDHFWMSKVVGNFPEPKNRLTKKNTCMYAGAYAGFFQGGGGGVNIFKSGRKFRNDSDSR